MDKSEAIKTIKQLQSESGGQNTGIENYQEIIDPDEVDQKFWRNGIYRLGAKAGVITGLAMAFDITAADLTKKKSSSKTKKKE